MLRIPSFTSLFIVPLMILCAIVSNSIFHMLQYATELLLLGIFVVLISYYKLTKQELILMIIFILAQVGSLIINPFPIFLLNAKQFGLAVFALIHFKRYPVKSVFLHISFVVCVGLILYEHLIGVFPVNISPILGTMKDSYGTRPLGLFLNYHYSSFFLAVYLVGYTVKKRLFLLDYYILWIISVKTNLVGYLGHKVFTLIQKKVWFFQSKLGTFYLLGGAVLFIVISITAILKLFEDEPYVYNSLHIILFQFVDPKSYLEAIYIFPQDVVRYLNENALFDFSELSSNFASHGSELTIVRLMVQGGIFLSFYFLLCVFKNFKTYVFFIFLTLFHYSFLLSPLIIYVMSAFEHSNNSENDDADK